MDAFSAQIVKFVRGMSDEALLELVKQKLGMAAPAHAAPKAPSAAPKAPAAKPAAAKPAPAKKPAASSSSSSSNNNNKKPAVAAAAAKPKPAAAAAPRPAAKVVTPADKQKVLDSIERFVKASSGVSSRDVALAVSMNQERAASLLKDLKIAKRVFQGGDRRFARYAGDQKAADQASMAARKSMAPPPPAEAAKAKSGGGKKPQAAAPAS